MNDLGFSVSDLTWNADQRVALVSRGDRADQCYCVSTDHVTGKATHHIGDSRYCESLILFARPA